MKRWIGFIAISAASISLFGCSMCCGPYDYDYPTFGGKHQRVNSNWGRVGSIFSDPLASSSGPSADSNLEAAPELRVNNTTSDEDDELELEKYRRELDDKMEGDLENLEKIDPDSLPGVDEDNETASRFIRNKLRAIGKGWR